MPNIFSKAFRANASSALGDSKAVISGSPLQALLSAVGRFKDYLSTKTGPEDSLFAALSLDSGLLHDDFVENDIYDYDLEDPPIVVVADDDIGDLLESGFSSAVHNGTESNIHTGITVTDSSGKSYNVVDQRSNDVIIAGTRVLFSSSYSCSSISEMILGRRVNDGKLVFNNIIRTADFHKPSPVLVDPTDLLGFTSSIALILEGVDYGKIYDNVLCFTHKDSGDIITCLQDFCTDKGLEVEEQHIMAYLSAIWQWVKSGYHPIAGQGGVQSIWNIVRDHAESTALNQALFKCAEFVLNPVSASQNIGPLVTDLLQNKYSSVKEFASRVRSAYANGGTTGVASLILGFAKGASGVTIADDGTFTFTDNSQFIPKSYLCGIIGSLITTVGTVVMMIGGIFGKILGAAMSLVGTIVSAIKSVSTSGARASLNTDNAILPIAPYGVCKMEIPVSRLFASSDAISLIDQGQGLFYAEIPGGYLIGGPGSFNDDGSIQTLRFEFHPSITCISDAAFNKLIQWFVDRGWFQAINVEATDVPPDRSFGKCNMIVSIYPGSSDQALDDICDIWNEGVYDRVYYNSLDGVVNADDDAVLRLAISRNLFIGALFCGIFTDTASWLNFNNSLSFGPAAYMTEDLLLNDAYTEGLWMAVNTVTVGIKVWETTHHSGFLHGCAIPSWADILNKMVHTADQQIVRQNEILVRLLNYKVYFGELTTYPPDLKYAITVPEYDADTFWSSILISLTVTAIAAGVCLAVSFGAKKIINRKRAFNDAAVYQASEEFKKNPNNDTYDAYRKAVKKNNRWATIIGGSKYDMVNYWNGDISGNSGSSTGSLVNKISTGGIINTTDLGESEISSTSDESRANDIKSVNSLIQKLIIG